MPARLTAPQAMAAKSTVLDKMKKWLGWQDSNLRMAVPKPLPYRLATPQFSILCVYKSMTASKVQAKWRNPLALE